MSPVAASDKTVLERRDSALKRANEVRTARAKLKDELRAGAIGLAPILAEPPDHVSTAKVLDLLVAVPRIGPVKAAHLLNAARITPTTTVAGLSARQRAALIELLRGRSSGRYS